MKGTGLNMLLLMIEGNLSDIQTKYLHSYASNKALNEALADLKELECLRNKTSVQRRGSYKLLAVSKLDQLSKEELKDAGISCLESLLEACRAKQTD